jgi:hypothetical protein
MDGLYKNLISHNQIVEKIEKLKEEKTSNEPDIKQELTILYNQLDDLILNLIDNDFIIFYFKNNEVNF